MTMETYHKTRPASPPIATTAEKVRRLLLTNHEAIDIGRKLGRLIVAGYSFDDPRVTQCADRLRGPIAEAAR